MHRSRLSLLAIVAASACSTRGDAREADILAQDPSLAAGLQDHQKAQQLPLPDVCGALDSLTAPSPAARREAQELARQAYDAELVGNARAARTLFDRASRLDVTDRSTAYHLGRANEALGDRSGAMTAYCRYIALTSSSTESAEARQRVAALVQRGTAVAAGHATYVTPAARRIAVAPVRRRAVHGRPVAATQIAEPTIEASSRASASQHGTPPERAASEGGTYSSNGSVDVGPPTSPATVSRGPSRIQMAGIGAVAGAIMGAAAGRSVKSAVIGAAAGGVIGTVVGGSTRPASRGLRHYASGA